MVLPFVFERFAVQTITIKKNLVWYYFLHFQEWFAVQIVVIKRNLIKYYFLYLNGLQCKTLQLRKI